MKVGLVIPGLNSSLVHKQPWYSLLRVASILRRDKEVHIISDSAGELVQHHLPTLRSFPVGISTESVKYLRQNFDALVWPVGVTDFWFKSSIEKIGLPFIAAVTTPFYSFNELLLLGSSCWRETKLFKQHFLSPITAKRNFERVLSKASQVLCFSHNTSEQLSAYCNPTVFLPRTAVNQEKTTKNRSGLVYFGAPLQIRGTDLSIKLMRHLPETKLTVLSRVDNAYYEEQNNRYLKLIEDMQLQSNIEVVSQKLCIQEVFNYVASAEVAVLPFRGVISEMPLVTLEALDLGTKVVTTRYSGLPPETSGAFISELISPQALADTCRKALNSNSEVSSAAFDVKIQFE